MRPHVAGTIPAPDSIPARADPQAVPFHAFDKATLSLHGSRHLNDEFRHALTPPPPYTAADRITWTDLGPGADALAPAQAARTHDSVLLVVARDTRSAARPRSGDRLLSGAEDDPEVLHFPTGKPCYDSFSPHQGIIRSASKRCSACWTSRVQYLSCRSRRWMIGALPTGRGRSLVLDVGASTRAPARDSSKPPPIAASTRCSSMANAVRGALMDIFPMGPRRPIASTLRRRGRYPAHFDPESQRTIDAVDSIRLLLRRSFPRQGCDPRLQGSMAHAIRRRRARRRPAYQDVGSGSVPPGVEYYLPLCFEARAHRPSGGVLCGVCAMRR